MRRRMGQQDLRFGKDVGAWCSRAFPTENDTLSDGGREDLPQTKFGPGCQGR